MRLAAAARWWRVQCTAASPQQSKAAGLLLRLALLLLCAFLPPAAAACGRCAVRWSTLQPADAAAPAALLCTCNKNSHLKAELLSLDLGSLSFRNGRCNRMWQSWCRGNCQIGIFANLVPSLSQAEEADARTTSIPNSEASPGLKTNALGLSGIAPSGN